MWQEMFSAVVQTVSVILCAAAIKLTDDYLDKDIDICSGHRNWAEFLGSGAMVYAALFLAVSVALSRSLSLSLFFSCYIVGMFNGLKAIYPSSFNGIQEAAIVFVLGIVLTNWEYMMFSFSFSVGVQLIDDCIDFKVDKKAGSRNLAHRFGVLECLLGATLSFMGAVLAAETVFLPTLVGVSLVYAISLWWQEGASWKVHG